MLLPQRPYSHVTVDKFAPVFFLISPLPKGSTQLLLGHIPSRCQVAQPPCPLHLTTHHTAIERLSLLTTTWNGDDLVALSTTWRWCSLVVRACLLSLRSNTRPRHGSRPHATARMIGHRQLWLPRCVPARTSRQLLAPHLLAYCAYRRP
jgi:hypothetical protein